VRSRRLTPVAAAVGAYIGAAYFFTSSTSFANPAITIGRVFSNSFAGIAPASVPAFVAAQLVGGALGLSAVRFLYPTPTEATAHEHSPVRLPPERRALADEPSPV
jgi:arsenate reductase